MSNLIVPGAATGPRELMTPRPDNVRGRFGQWVTSDVFHIADRLKELDPHLMVSALDPPVVWAGKTYHFTISEMCRDGVERFVTRAQALDGRVVTSCERMLRVPFEHRFAEAEKEADKWEAEEHERQLDLLYERMGGNMRIQLERCGFTDPWGAKYQPMNKTARRHRNAKGLVGVPAR